MKQIKIEKDVAMPLMEGKDIKMKLSFFTINNKNIRGISFKLAKREYKIGLIFHYSTLYRVIRREGFYHIRFLWFAFGWEGT